MDVLAPEAEVTGSLMSRAVRGVTVRGVTVMAILISRGGAPRELILRTRAADGIDMVNLAVGDAIQVMAMAEAEIVETLEAIMAAEDEIVLEKDEAVTTWGAKGDRRRIMLWPSTW